MKGKIYCIECLITGEKYFGSTEREDDARKKNHIFELQTYKNGNKKGICASHTIIQRGNYKMYTVKEVEFENVSELLWEERWAIEADPQAINIKKPILTEEERIEVNAMCARRYAKNHYHENKEECLEKNKAYRQTEKGKESKAKSDKKYREGEHREELLAKKREYHHANKEVIAEKNKAYREANAEVIKERKKAEYLKAKENGLCEIIHCECGGTYTHRSKARHLKTKKHTDYYLIKE